MIVAKPYQVLDNLPDLMQLTSTMEETQLACHDDVVALESLFPNLIIGRASINGITDTPSLENFSKIKDAVSKTISEILKKIKAFIESIISFFRGKEDKTKDAKKTADDMKETEKEFTKKAEEATNKPEPEEDLKKSTSYNPYDHPDEDGLVRFSKDSIDSNGINNSLKQLTAQELVAIVKSRKIPVDDIITSVLANKLNILFVAVDDDYKYVMLDQMEYSLEYAIAVKDAFKGLYEHMLAVYTAETDGRQIRKTIDKASSKLYETHDSVSSGAEEAGKKLAGFLHRTYKISAANYNGDVEKDGSLYSLTALMLKSNERIEKVLTKPIDVESVHKALDFIAKHSAALKKSLEEADKLVEQLIDMESDYTKVGELSSGHAGRGFDSKPLEIRLQHYTFRELVFEVSMISRTYALVLNSFNTIVKNSERNIALLKEATNKL